MWVMHRRHVGAGRVVLQGSRLLLLCALGCAAAPLDPTSAQAAPKQAPAACVVQRTEVRHSGVGYDHWVHLTNNCDATVSCQVRTNVNTEGMSVTVEPKATASVLTWRGSPAREFTATVECHYAG